MRILLYFLLLIALQGATFALLPLEWGGPDLFLLTSVALALRLNPLGGMTVAYGLGLVQDMLGHGYLGLHAAGLAGGVLFLHGLRGLVLPGPAVREAVALVAAVLGQWATFLVLTYWLRDGLVTVSSLTRVLPLELLLTLLLYPVLRPFLTWCFGPLERREVAV